MSEQITAGGASAMALENKDVVMHMLEVDSKSTKVKSKEERQEELTKAFKMSLSEDTRDFLESKHRGYHIEELDVSSVEGLDSLTAMHSELKTGTLRPLTLGEFDKLIWTTRNKATPECFKLDEYFLVEGTVIVWGNERYYFCTGYIQPRNGNVPLKPRICRTTELIRGKLKFKSLYVNK